MPRVFFYFVQEKREGHLYHNAIDKREVALCPWTDSSHIVLIAISIQHGKHCGMVRVYDSYRSLRKPKYYNGIFETLAKVLKRLV